jgi:hypothetical protein
MEQLIGADGGEIFDVLLPTITSLVGKSQFHK